MQQEYSIFLCGNFVSVSLYQQNDVRGGDVFKHPSPFTSSWVCMDPCGKNIQFLFLFLRHSRAGQFDFGSSK
jgi:hypothetical protein